MEPTCSLHPQVGFFKEIFHPAKVTMIPKKCKKGGDHPLNDLVKSGYKPKRSRRVEGGLLIR